MGVDGEVCNFVRNLIYAMGGWMGRSVVSSGILCMLWGVDGKVCMLWGARGGILNLIFNKIIGWKLFVIRYKVKYHLNSINSGISA